MYPLRINLLTEQKRDHLISMAKFKFIQNILQIILLAISVASISLLISENFLQNYFTSISQNTVSVSNSYTSQSNEIMTINKLTKKLSEVQKKYHQVTPIILSLVSSTPDGIVLNSLNISYTEKTLSFSGLASTRQNFLDFQEALNTNPDLTDVQSPVSDLTKKENIIFNISAKIK